MQFDQNNKFTLDTPLAGELEGRAEAVETYSFCGFLNLVFQIEFSTVYHPSVLMSKAVRVAQIITLLQNIHKVF